MNSNLPQAKSPFAPLLLISPFFFWGTAMVAMKGVIPNSTPLFMAGIRLVPAGLLVLLVGMILRRPQPKGWQAWVWISLFALIDGAMFQGFLAEGLARTGAGLGSVMIDSQPLAVALMALWFFGEKIGVWGWLGLALGVAGISLLGLPDEWISALWQNHALPVSFQGGSDLVQNLFQNGQWLMLLAALSMAVGTVVMRVVSRYADPITATGWHMILGGLPLFALSSQFEVDQWIHLDAANWLAMAYSTIFGSAIAYGLFFYFAASGSLTSLSSLTFLTPVFALLFGNLFLGELLNSIQWFGVSLTLVSIYLVNQREQLAAKFSRTPAIDASLLQPTDSVPMTELTQVPVRLTEPE